MGRKEGQGGVVGRGGTGRERRGRERRWGTEGRRAARKNLPLVGLS